MKPRNETFCSLIALSVSLALVSCGGGQAETPPPQNPPSQNPQPSITAVTPTAVPAGGPDFILTVNGAGFVTASEIRWNGASRGTTFVSSTILRAQILANDIATSGNVEVTVFNPAPGGGASNAMTFTIISAVPLTARVIDRVNVDSAGVQASGGISGNPSISARGRFIAFHSNASNLVPGDTNGLRDVFVRDTCMQTVGCTPSTIRVSVDSAGAQAMGGDSAIASISADGRFVAFYSDSTNLVADDTNGIRDIFVRDTCIGSAVCTPSTIRVSVDDAGAQAIGVIGSGRPSISANGRFVAFESDASNLVAGDTNAVFDVFVRDTCAGATGCTPSTMRVSVDSAGAQANGDSGSPSVSFDGRFVAFESDAANLVTGDTNGLRDIFVRDTCTGATGCTPSTIRLSVNTTGTQATDGDSRNGSISADGRFVAFESDASNLVANDTNFAVDVFVRDTCAGAAACVPSTVRVSVSSTGAEGTGLNGSGVPSISADGRFVAFMSDANNLVNDDRNLDIFKSFDVFVRDTCVGASSCTATTVRASVNSLGIEGNEVSMFPSLSADGRFVTLESQASNLVAGDTNNLIDLFLAQTGFGQP
jgi:Tol biopolymer transport system component